MFKKTIALLLISALAFGQVGAGFFHNKHDAHETVLDLDHTVLVNHGEHCKVCAVDWVAPFIEEAFELPLVETSFIFLQPADASSPGDFNLIKKSSRAPPSFS